LFYLSVWKNAISAQAFARLYAKELGLKYSGVKLESATGSGDKGGSSSRLKVFPPPAESSDESETSNQASLPGEQVYSTNEGPVVITTRDRMVFVAESFPLELARKLTGLILDAQGTGEVHLARSAQPGSLEVKGEKLKPLTGNLVHLISECGVMKVAVDAAMQAGR